MGKDTLEHVAKNKPTKVQISSLRGNLLHAHLKAGRGTSLAHCR